MVRKVPGKSPSKKSRKSDGECSKHLSTNPEFETSVHKRNLCIVSFPIILLFNILKSLLYQIFVILRFLYYSSLHFIVKQPNKVEVLEIASNEEATLTSEENLVMPLTNSSHSGPGPGDPLLAKQKHHHRRAFEFISKALKIDEENEGNNSHQKIQCFIHLFYPKVKKNWQLNYTERV